MGSIRADIVVGPTFSISLFSALLQHGSSWELTSDIHAHSPRCMHAQKLTRPNSKDLKDNIQTVGLNKFEGIVLKKLAIKYILIFLCLFPTSLNIQKKTAGVYRQKQLCSKYLDSEISRGIKIWTLYFLLVVNNQFLVPPSEKPHLISSSTESIWELPPQICTVSNMVHLFAK